MRCVTTRGLRLASFTADLLQPLQQNLALGITIISMPKDLFLPTELPWAELKGRDLEELLYWLFDSMGAKDLEWRIGGAGSGAADAGRDLEMSFYVSSPDGDLVRQRWWVEAKGRAGTVEPADVKHAVVNVASRHDIDVLVVATNSLFSNPTRDWVREWQSNNPRPRVKLWERTELESHCSKNPIAVVRLFTKALSSQGKLEVAAKKLWDYAAFTDVPTLAALWADRSSLEIDSRGLVALAASEIANGSVEERSWAVFVDEDIVLDALGDGLINFLYLLFRAHEAGVRADPLVRALSYLLLVATYRCGESVVSDLLERVWESVAEREYPAEIRRVVVQPILESLSSELRDVCTSDCARISTKPLVLSDREVRTYLQRLSIGSDHDAKTPERVLMFESFDEPCRIGLALDKQCHCPFGEQQDGDRDVRPTLELVRLVAMSRHPKRE
ncbi:hypothetical protein GAU_3492 [Gemmatimonas aurantiaca T-27]|uniref:Restriction endonuclease type IV Mrr domain-containing protein n=2 Tax=Gemmatimonas aurantiaca TaxID=173480 RepID=C1ADF7_GEMAT|nr:hypothetical protein GAU_3492 [Gemmatimonas aurantiaca T-27]